MRRPPPLLVPWSATVSPDPVDPALAPPRGAGSGRTVRRPRRHPDRRATVGALLVTLAATGAWWLGQAPDGPTPSLWLVASVDLEPGRTLRTADLEAQPMVVPPALARRAFPADRLAELEGRSILGPVAAGELLQGATIGARAAPDGARELTLRVDADWALGGALAAGDRVDLLVTYGDGAGSTTRRVLAGAVLRQVRVADGDALLASPGVVVTVAIADADRVLAVTDAARAGALTVVRATGADPVTDDRTFRPELSDRDDGSGSGGGSGPSGGDGS